MVRTRTGSKLLALAFSLIGSLPVQGALEFPEVVRESVPFSPKLLSYSSNPLSEYAEVLAHRNQHTYANLESWQSKDPVEAKSCSDVYDDIFRDGVMRITLAFGYHDNSPSTLDGRHYSYVFDALTRSCPSSQSTLCGFHVVSGSESGHSAVLAKEISFGRGGDRRRVRIQFNLAHAADSEDDDANLVGGQASPRQRAISRMVEDLFFGGVSGVKADGSAQDKCDICGYYGHARNGGGPDFSPVPYAWRDSKGEPDYSYYLSRRTGYRRLLASLERAGDEPPKMVSLMACYSHKHFWSKKICVENKPGCTPHSLSDYAGKTGFVLSRAYSWPENFDKMVGVLLDTVLGQKCKSAWDSNMGRLRGLPGNAEDYGLFGKFY